MAKGSSIDPIIVEDDNLKMIPSDYNMRSEVPFFTPTREYWSQERVNILLVLVWYTDGFNNKQGTGGQG